jgi:hypothetical protein
MEPLSAALTPYEGFDNVIVYQFFVLPAEGIDRPDST